MEKLYTVNQLAHEFGVTTRALRFYETKGLLAPQRVGSTRAYSRRDRGRLQLILRGKRLGFTLAEIKEYLSLYNVDTEQVEQLRLLHQRVQQRVSVLEQQRVDVERTLQELADIADQVNAALAQHGSETDPTK